MIHGTPLRKMLMKIPVSTVEAPPSMLEGPLCAYKADMAAQLEERRMQYRKDRIDLTAEALTLAVSKMRAATQRIEESRNKKTIVVLENPPKMHTVPKTAPATKTAAPKCRAKTLEGRPCPFSATCEGFCRKHFSMM